jgi:insulysin
LADADAFVTPERDPRKYRYLQLANGLHVLLACDEQRTNGIGVEAASVHVQAGHFDDTIPGLAHFHEHMLFLGTKKYPQEDDYEAFLSQFGGFSNAYTDMEDTNYFFSVTTDASDCFVQELDPSTNQTTTLVRTTDGLQGALDRLAQFFVAPLFDESAVEREVRAIDSEYRNGKTSDSWRLFQLMKSIADPRHPFAKFGCGNYETLMETPQRKKLLEQLREFWSQYYQTYNMRLAVVGHGSLDALQKTVEETFGKLPFSKGPPRRIANRPDQLFVRENAVYGGIPAFGAEQLAKLRYILPFTETRTIKVYFSTPPLDDPKLAPSKPYRVLSHFLGHEAPGSLHALLSELGYLNSLTSGMALDTSDFSLFSLTLSLTKKGMEQKDTVLQLVFQWIALLRDQDDDQLRAYHDELRQIAATNFRFRENSDPADFCSSASEIMFYEDLDPSRILIVSNEATEYDPVVTRAFLDRMRPQNAMIHIVNSDMDTSSSSSSDEDWKTEKWYGAKYKEEELSAEQMEAWEHPETIDPRLQAPALNAYIPTDFSLRCDDDDGQTDLPVSEESVKVPPVLLQNQPKIRLWHKMDRYWRVPKAFVRVALLSPSTYSSPRSMTLNRIYQRVLNDDLNSFVYDASVAGCSYKVSCVPNGYRISVRGYNEKLPFLLDTLTTRMLSLIQEMKTDDPLLREKFEKAKQGLLRETKNYRLDSPYEVANYNSRLLIEENVWYLDNYISEMEGEAAKTHPLTMEECARAAEESLMGRVKCEILCMGNMNEKEALQVSDVLDRHFLGSSRVLTEVETPSFRSMKLPTRDEAVLIFGPAVKDKSIPLVYQDLAFSDTEENNAVELILQAGSELDLGYEGLALLDLICHMAYNSAFNMLRTKEQLGYIVSANARRTAGGGWGMSVIVQSSVALPEKLEERIEAWLAVYRKELEEMSPESMAREASAVAALFLESETKMSQEVSRVWGEILNTEAMTDSLRTPAFDRLEFLADELSISDNSASQTTTKAGTKRKSAIDLKQRVLEFFDDHFASSSPKRRALSARVFRHSSKQEYEEALSQPGVLSTFSDMRYLKQFLGSWPKVPYWRVEEPRDPNQEGISTS